MQNKTALFLFGVIVILVGIVVMFGLNIPNSSRHTLIGGPSSSYSISMDTVNGNPPTTICFVGPITLTGHFSITNPVGQPSQYNVEIEWEPGVFENSHDNPSDIVVTQTGYDPATDTTTFDFTATHTAANVVSSINLHLYHTQPPGNSGGGDANYSSSVCVAPPTMAVLNIKKAVTNTHGGTAVPTDFTLHLKHSGSEVTGAQGTSPFSADSVNGTDFLIIPDANPAYTLSEDLLPNYQQTGITGSCANDGSITLVANTNYSCTIENNDTAPATTHIITASAGANGSISPSGTITVNDSSDQQFLITPSAGYHVLDVLVDGVSVGAVASYPFSTVTADHTISAAFAQDSGGGGGSPNNPPVAHNASVAVTKNTSIAITFSATDADNDPLTYSIANPPQGTTPGALGAITGNQVMYTPAPGFVGTDSFTFLANDGQADSNTATISITITAPPPSGGGGGGTTHGSGPSSTTIAQSISTDCTTEVYLDKFLRLGYQNDPAAVLKLQTFLNHSLNTNIPTIGIFGPLTESAVRTFQILHADKILEPWHETAPTGIVYTTTVIEINNNVCPALNLPIPSNLVPWNENPLTPNKLN